MTTRTNWQRIGSLVLMTISLLFIADTQASAQKKNYKLGEKIEYLAETYPKEVWEVGTFVEATPGGSQPIIRQKPNEFYKDGFQIATSWDKVRPLGAGKADADNERKPEETENNEPTIETTNDFGTGLMSKEQVLSFLQTKLGDKPFANPRLEEIKKELGEIIKRRGLDFRFSSSDTAFYNKLGKYGATSEMIFPLRDNHGAPTKQSWLMGAWQLGKIGAAVDYVRNNRVYRQGEIGVGNIGTLSLNANGTYVWKSVLTAQPASGKWRNATNEEMRSQGGDGIVLLKAQSGEDWIVAHDRNTTLKGDWINIAQLNSRSIKEYGSRGGKK